MALPKNSENGNYSLVTSLFMILLTVGIVSTVAINVYQDKEQERKLMYIWGDYMPTIFMEGMMKTYSLQTETIVARMGGDPEQIKKENERFDALRTELLNNLQKMRGGMTSITRGGSAGGNNGSSD